MFVDMYKAGGHFSPSNSEKIVKIIASQEEMDLFKKGAEKVIAAGGERYEGFRNHVVNDWRPYTPYSDEEKEEYKDKPAFILRIWERDVINVTVFWFWLISEFGKN